MSFAVGGMMRKSILALAVAASATAGFVGLAAAPAMAEGLPVVHESVTVDPNNSVAPGSLVSLCLTPKSLGGSQACIQL